MRRDSDASWSEDGAAAAFVRQAGKSEAIYMVGADGSNLRRVVTLASLRPLAGQRISTLSRAGVVAGWKHFALHRSRAAHGWVTRASLQLVRTVLGSAACGGVRAPYSRRRLTTMAGHRMGVGFSSPSIGMTPGVAEDGRRLLSPPISTSAVSAFGQERAADSHG